MENERTKDEKMGLLVREQQGSWGAGEGKP